MRTNWIPLPPNLPSPVRELTEHLRTLKDSSGWTLAELGTRTHYGSSSWERWLNGKRLVTKPALISLAAALDVDAQTLLDLLERTEAEPLDGSVDPDSRDIAGDRGDIGAPVEPGASSSPDIAQLPAAITDFAGRRAQISLLSEALTVSGRGPGQIPIATVTGAAGMGKTTLAVQVGHLIARRFPDGQFFLDLHGMDQAPLDPARVLQQCLLDLGVASDAVPDTVEARSARLRSLLYGKRFLMVLDNAKDAAQVRPLLPASEGCAVLVTSRSALASLAAAVHVDLSTLTPDEGSELFTAIVGTQRTEAEPDAAREILRVCAGLPLALRIVAARLISRRTRSLASVATRLADQRRRLDELAVADIAVRTAFVTSYEALGRDAAVRGPHPVRIFRMAALVPGRTVSGPELQALIGEPDADCETALDSLVEQHMLMPHGDHRYEFHDLLRDFAAERVEEALDAAGRKAARIRLATYYASAATAACMVLWEMSKPGPHPITPEPGIPTAPTFTDQTDSIDWYADHAENLVAAIDTAAADHRPDLAVHVILALFPYAMSNPRVDYQAHAERGIALARESGDLLSEAWLWRRLGVFHGLWERVPECITALEHALRLHRQAQDEYGTIFAMGNLASAYRLAQRYDECLAIGREVIALVENREEQDMDPGNEYATLAHAFLDLGRYEEAVLHFQKSLDYERSAKNRAVNLNNLGDAYLALGRHDEAIAALDAASQSYAMVDDDLGRAEVVHSLGRTHRDLGDLPRARDHFTSALQSFRDLGFQPGIERAEADLLSLDGELG